MPQAFNPPIISTDLEARDGSKPQGFRCATRLAGMARRPGEAMISRSVSPPSWRGLSRTGMVVSVNLFSLFAQEKSSIHMAGKSKSTGKAKDDLEIVPDSWERFERAVDAAVKSGPKHRQRPKIDRKERPASKGRVHKGKSRA